MDPQNNRPIAGIGDEVEWLPPGQAPSWSVFWQSDDVDASVAKVSALGGAVLTEAADHGLGRVARVADPSGARFSLFRPRG
jgi:predicted enzyme related to lactoylglutathione lyase